MVRSSIVHSTRSCSATAHISRTSLMARMLRGWLFPGQNIRDGIGEGNHRNRQVQTLIVEDKKQKLTRLGPELTCDIGISYPYDAASPGLVSLGSSPRTLRRYPFRASWASFFVACSHTPYLSSCI
jgi:hypothetical protein